MTINTWEEAIKDAAALVLTVEGFSNTHFAAKMLAAAIGDLGNVVVPSDLLQAHSADAARYWAASDAYLDIAAAALALWSDGYPSVAANLLRDVTLLCAKKQHDYGHDNITTFGHLGLAVRLNDKLARLQNLKKRPSAANESVTDTYNDIVGYALIGLMLLDDTFKLPLAADQ